MSNQRTQDILIILRGLQTIIGASIKLNEVHYKQIWDNSSFNIMATDNDIRRKIQNVLSQKELPQNFSKLLPDMLERTFVVMGNVKEYAKHTAGFETLNSNTANPSLQDDKIYLTDEAKCTADSRYVDDKFKSLVSNTINKDENSNTINKDGNSQTVYSEVVSMRKSGFSEVLSSAASKSAGNEILRNDCDKNLLIASSKSLPQVQVKPKQRQTLSEMAKQRTVPSTRLERMLSFGGLAAGLGVGTVAELARRTWRPKSKLPTVSQVLESPLLTEANAERIVNTLCKVRGAALKIGQILSIQDSTIMNPNLQQVFERVRKSADFMPWWQVEKVLARELGEDWRSKLGSFESKPFAAASIGQVHLVTLLDEKEVAMKIQYPGVARGIASDIDNLVGILKVWNIFPKGMFIDNVVEVAKRELAWEVDYIREAECSKQFKIYLEPYPEYYVPKVIDELSTKQIFSSELVEGIPIDKCVDLDLETRELVARRIMQLCLKELFEFLYMQTDPNWANFFYNQETKQLALLDFGASRSYSREFMDQYIQVIRGAADGNRDKVLQVSKELGFLTGYESKIMEETHIDAVMLLGQVFRKSTPFDFGKQDTTHQLQSLVPIMLKHRLRPPPEEIYSLHRKLSGVFLLCAKLKVKIECKSMFEEAYQNYK